MKDLKPCPFCGCEAKVKEYEVMDADGDERNAWGIACSNHKCIAFETDLVSFLSLGEAIEAWNRRADDDTERTIS